MGTRLTGWERILAREIEAARGRPFQWGTHDCASWAFAVRRALTGQRPSRSWAGRHATARGALRVMRRLGWRTLEDLARAELGAPRARHLLAQRGDIVLAGAGVHAGVHAGTDAAGAFGGALGICTGRDAAFVGPGGLVFVALRAATAAWKV